MKTKIHFSKFILLSLILFSCSKDASLLDRQGTTVNNPPIAPGSKDTCTHGRQYYLNFNVDSVPVICDGNLWAKIYGASDIEMNGSFSTGNIYLVAANSLEFDFNEFPISFWNSIKLDLSGQTYYAGMEYGNIIGSGNIRINGTTGECVLGSFECKTGISQYYGTSSIKTIKDGVFHLKRSL